MSRASWHDRARSPCRGSRRGVASGQPRPSPPSSGLGRPGTGGAPRSVRDHARPSAAGGGAGPARALDDSPRGPGPHRGVGLWSRGLTPCWWVRYDLVHEWVDPAFLRLEVGAMTWEAPDFIEVKMDAEINSYQDDFEREQDDRF